MSDLIVKSAVKDALTGNNVSADFYDALNAEVEELLEELPACRGKRPEDRAAV